jgi:hypothetical protein
LIKQSFNKYFELVFWIAALIALALTNPTPDSYRDQAHFTLCPLKLLGFNWCPGCGLGHAISFLFHGDIRRSFHAHWLGIPALIIIVYRIYVLIRLRLQGQVQLGSL